jgi:nicotinamidase-related amidase
VQEVRAPGVGTEAPVTEPDKTALLFIECQRGVVGDFSVLPALAASAAPVLATMGRLAAAARESGVQVAHLTFQSAAGGRSTNRRSPLMRATLATAAWNETHPAAEVVPEIGVGPDDLVLPRHQGISPVHRTETLAMLRNMGIEEVVVAGVSTNLAVPLVAVAAADEDFAVTIPTDACVGTPPEHHTSMLANGLAFVARLTTVGELVAGWSA